MLLRRRCVGIRFRQHTFKQRHIDIAAGQHDADPLALQDDLHLVVDILADQPGQRRLNYVAQFLHGIARSAEDTDLGDLASVLARPDSDPAQVAALLRQRLPQQKAI